MYPSLDLKKKLDFGYKDSSPSMITLFEIRNFDHFHQKFPRSLFATQLDVKTKVERLVEAGAENMVVTVPNAK